MEKHITETTLTVEEIENVVEQNVAGIDDVNLKDGNRVQFLNNIQMYVKPKEKVDEDYNTNAIIFDVIDVNPINKNLVNSVSHAVSAVEQEQVSQELFSRLQKMAEKIKEDDGGGSNPNPNPNPNPNRVVNEGFEHESWDKQLLKTWHILVILLIMFIALTLL